MRILALALAALAFTALPAAAQQQIGSTTSVKPAAHGSVAGTLSVGAGVHRSSGEALLNVDKGSFRFTTGNQNSRVKIKTPYGTLGTRD